MPYIGNTLVTTVSNDQTNIQSIYNTSLKMGRDSQNLIDFATTDDVIILRAANANQIRLQDGALVPVTTNDIDLGTASLEFKSAWFDGTVTADAFAGPLTGNVTGTADVATVATTVTISDNESTNENNAIIFTAGGDVDGGNIGLESDGTLTYNPSTGTVTATTFAGALTGNASTATALANARTIGGTSFDGTANIAVALAATATTLATARTIGGTSFDGSANIAVALAATATTLATGRTIGGTSFDGSANIVPATITVADTTDTTSFVALFESATGDLAPKTDAGITYNAGTGMLTATGIAGTTGTFSGILKTDDTTEAASTTDGSLQTDGGLSVVLNAVFGNDVKLLSDAAVLNFGEHSDVNLTHVADTALLLNTTMQLQFGDSGTYIHQSADGVLDLVSDTEIEINATTIDINGAVEVSGNLDVAGSLEVATIDFTDGDNAITIADTGIMTFPQQVTVTKNIALTQGGTDGDYSGITATFTAGEALEAGEVVVMHSDGEIYKALSKTGSTAANLIGAEKPAIGVVVADCANDGTAIVLLNGFMTHNANFPAYNEGSTLYVPEDETSSKAVPEDAAPDTDGDFVQVIGVAVHENRIWVNPDLTVIEVA